MLQAVQAALKNRHVLQVNTLLREMRGDGEVSERALPPVYRQAHVCLNHHMPCLPGLFMNIH